MELKINDPQLVLVVGNWENTNPEEVAEAMRMYERENIDVIDYDTLVQLFYSATLEGTG